MKVEIWSDFTCPFCFIGKRKFELALEQFENNQYVKVEFKSYQLDPTANVNNETTVYHMLMEKYGFTLEKAKEMTSQIIELGNEVGLTIQFDEMKHTNTFHAHRLVKFAKKQGKEHDVVNLLFHKYFTENENIGQNNVLIGLANDLNLDEKGVQELLSLNCYSKLVEEDEQLAREIGVNGVPFFVFNEKYALSGAQPVEVFLSALNQLWSEEKDKILSSKDSALSCKASYCVGNECDE